MSYIIRFKIKNGSQTLGKEVDKINLLEVNKFYEDMCKLYGKDLVSFKVYEGIEERI